MNNFFSKISLMDNTNHSSLFSCVDSEYCCFGFISCNCFFSQRLWECNVDKETNRISLEQLCIELRAGGISDKHEREVREKLGHLKSLDLLDFLTYVPLFIMIHQSVVDNPLNDVRDK